MKTTKTLAALAAASLIALSQSCSKNPNGSSPGGASSVSLLTSSRWTFQKLEYEQPSGTWVADPYASSRDAFTVGFSSNNTTTEYDPANGYNTPGTWAFSSNNTVLTTTQGVEFYPAVYTVNALSSSTLQVTNPNFAGITYIGIRFTFTH